MSIRLSNLLDSDPCSVAIALFLVLALVSRYPCAGSLFLLEGT